MFYRFIHIFLDLFLPQKCFKCQKLGFMVCEKCLKASEFDSFPSQSIFAAGDYRDPLLKKAVWFFKYRGVKGLAEPLASLIYTRLSSRLNNSKDWILVPIPLHKSRSRERGYNQSELLAQKLGGKFGFEFLNDVLIKTIATESQVEIKNRNKRLNNMNGVFEVKDENIISGKNIILVDDVSTTGTTINEARRVLKLAGAKKVIGFVIARG